MMRYGILCILFFSLVFTCSVIVVSGAFLTGPLNSTVLGPIVDGINLKIPDKLEKSPLASLGLVDVTEEPFLADPDGKRDSTNAIQAAINFARDHQMVCFFPLGIYLISDTLQCIQNNYRRSNGKIVGGRNFPCVLMGSRGGKRPRIILMPRSPGFQDPKRPKYIIHFWARKRNDPSIPQPNISMNQMLTGIDITIGKGNPGAVAVRMRAAQGSGVEDCTIDAGHGLTGIEGGSGSGGSFANITIIGGQTGLDLRQTQPAPTIVGITLIGQKHAAIVYEGRQSLCAVGVNIDFSGKGPAVIALSGGRRPATAQVCIMDSVINFERPGGTGISAAKSLYLNNVYFRNAGKAVSNPDGSEIPGNKRGWIRIKEYAHGVNPKEWKGYQYRAPTYINGEKIRGDLCLIEKDKAPPGDLQTRHLWSENFPGWEAGEMANVKDPPYNAKGDGKTDDTAALQSAIDGNRLIFLPKGYYRITTTIKLRPGSKLIGVARHLSIIMARPGCQAFQDPKYPKPLVDTNSEKNIQTVIAFLGIYVPKELQGGYALRWQCSGRSILRDVNFITQPIMGYSQPGSPEKSEIPLVLVRGNGGGKWYNFFQESHRGQGLGYRHLLVSGANGPFSIYQCNPEHAQGEANMEIRASKNVSIYGLKSEGNHPVLMIEDSDNIRIFGYGGNAAALEGRALFVVKDTPNFLVANAVDSPRLPHKRSSNLGFGRGVDPRLWSMISEEQKKGSICWTLPLERPVLYRRGELKPIR